MSGIRSTNTRIEISVRSALHARGLRFRLHRRDLPGKPDVVFPGRKAAVFLHGCFWHGHDCHLFRLPATRREFWDAKIAGNRARDRKVIAALNDMGWRTFTVWECALRGRTSLTLEKVVDRLSAWIVSGKSSASLTGSTDPARAHSGAGQCTLPDGGEPD